MTRRGGGGGGGYGKTNNKNVSKPKSAMRNRKSSVSLLPFPIYRSFVGIRYTQQIYLPVPVSEQSTSAFITFRVPGIGHSIIRGLLGFNSIIYNKN